MRSLHEHLAILDETELKTSALFDGVVARLQITYFCVQRCIALLKFLVDVALARKLAIHVPDAVPTALAEPQRVLQQQDQDSQYQRRPTHGGELLAQVVEGSATRVTYGIAKILLNAQQLVVLGNPIGAGKRTGLDLAGIEAHSDVGNGRIFGLTGAV